MNISDGFFLRSSIEVARDLLGCRFYNRDNGAGARIVETEAYPGEEDPACHYDGGSTARGEVFEKGPGTVYVYVIHGHRCMNLICGSEEYPEGVLLRAAEPLTAVDLMKENRGRSDPVELCSGPAKLCEAMGIEREGFNGLELAETPLELEQGDSPEDVGITRRIGVKDAEDWPLRFVEPGNSHLSTSRELSGEDPEEYHPVSGSG